MPGTPNQHLVVVLVSRTAPPGCPLGAEIISPLCRGSSGPPQMSARPAKQRACPRHAHHSNGTAKVQHPVLQREVEPEIEVKLGGLEVVLVLASSMPGGGQKSQCQPSTAPFWMGIAPVLHLYDYFSLSSRFLSRVSVLGELFVCIRALLALCSSSAAACCGRAADKGWGNCPNTWGHATGP